MQDDSETQQPQPWTQDRLWIKANVCVIAVFTNEQLAENVGSIPRPDTRNLSNNWAFQNSQIESSLDSVSLKSLPQHFASGRTGRHIIHIILISKMHCPRRKHERNRLSLLQALSLEKKKGKNIQRFKKMHPSKHDTPCIPKLIGTNFSQTGTHSIAQVFLLHLLQKCSP